MRAWIAVLTLILPTAATGDLVTAVRAADVRVPMAAVVLDQAETVQLLPRATDGGLSGTAAEPTSIPAYGDGEAAAHALARAAAYGLWRAQPTGQLREFSDVAENQAQGLIREFLGCSPEGGWLSPGETATLLGCYHIPVTSPGPLAQPAGLAGTEVMIGVAQEPVFGPVITFGTGGADAGALANRAARLVPLTDADADELIRSVRTPPLLSGHNAAEPAGLTALPDILLRVSRLADDLPEIADSISTRSPSGPMAWPSGRPGSGLPRPSARTPSCGTCAELNRDAAPADACNKAPGPGRTIPGRTQVPRPDDFRPWMVLPQKTNVGNGKRNSAGKGPRQKESRFRK